MQHTILLFLVSTCLCDYPYYDEYKLDYTYLRDNWQPRLTKDSICGFKIYQNEDNPKNAYEIYYGPYKFDTDSCDNECMKKLENQNLKEEYRQEKDSHDFQQNNDPHIYHQPTKESLNYYPREHLKATQQSEHTKQAYERDDNKRTHQQFTYSTIYRENNGPKNDEAHDYKSLNQKKFQTKNSHGEFRKQPHDSKEPNLYQQEQFKSNYGQQERYYERKNSNYQEPYSQSQCDMKKIPFFQNSYNQANNNPEENVSFKTQFSGPSPQYQRNSNFKTYQTRPIYRGRCFTICEEFLNELKHEAPRLYHRYFNVYY